MSKYGNPGTATGAAFVPRAVETIATALAAPVVDYEKLKISSNPINIAELSGKREGAVVLAKSSSDSKWYICVAEDDLPTSKWSCVELDTAVVPADA